LRIVVDVTPLSLPRTGIGNYVRGMVGGLAAVAGPNEIVALAPTGLRGRRHVAAALADIPVEKRIWGVPGAYYWRALWSRAGRPFVERFAGALDVFHFSDWMYPAQRHGVRTTTVHDLVPLHFPELVHPRTHRLHTAKLRNAVRTCDVIFANSRFTADDLHERLAFARDRIHVAYPGIESRFRPEGPRAALDAPYVLSVATLEPRKNLDTLVRAFQAVRGSRPELVLAVAGTEAPPGTPESSRPGGEGVRLLGFVSDDELAQLYRGAAAFAYPSIYEGFGMPIVEALASRVPVVSSAHPSLDEASGDAAVRADPSDPEAFADGIETALAADQDRLDAGVRHAQQFSWEACGEAVLRGYQSAL
jgi:glycosyltransferase involved in cell wall biosynthesis